MKKTLFLVLTLITLSIGVALAEIHPGYWQGGPVYPNGAREYDLMLTYNGYEDNYIVNLGVYRITGLTGTADCISQDEAIVTIGDENGHNLLGTLVSSSSGLRFEVIDGNVSSLPEGTVIWFE